MTMSNNGLFQWCLTLRVRVDKQLPSINQQIAVMRFNPCANLNDRTSTNAAGQTRSMTKFTFDIVNPCQTDDWLN